MSHFSNDHPSVRVHAPPGGRSNNIFGTNPEEPHTKPGTLAGQYKQTQMKSNIFGSEEPAPMRSVSNKNQSNIFGPEEPAPMRSVSNKNQSNIFGSNDNDEQNKRQQGIRQGLRDPNASRMGYNPINGESYSVKDNTKSNVSEESANEMVKLVETGNTSAQTTPSTAENSKSQKSADKPNTTADGNNAQKPLHTSVRVFHPPGGKSSGPLW